MGIQMVVISISALALIGMVNREGVDTAAAFGVAMQLWTYVQMPAMASARRSARWPRRTSARANGPGRPDDPVGIIQSLLITGALIVLLTLADRAVLALFMGRSPALPIARHIHVLATWNFLLFGVTMVLIAHGPRQRRGMGAADDPRHRPGPGPLRLDFATIIGSARTRSGPASRSALSSTSRWPPLIIRRRLEESAADGSSAGPMRTSAPRRRWRPASPAARSIPRLMSPPCEVERWVASSASDSYIASPLPRE